MELGLQGRVALICAASAGLGRASAEAIVQEGAHAVICSRDHDRIRDAARSIAGSAGAQWTSPEDAGTTRDGGPARVVPVVADLRQAEEIRRLVATAIKIFGRVDALVANAGGPPVGSFADLDDARWAAGIELTLMSTVRLIREVLPAMQARRWGRIVTITSVAAKQPINDLVISSSLRPGILGLTKVLANRYGKEGILINAVAPGFILTARQDEILSARAAERGVSREQYLEESSREIPVGRLGRPDELGAVVAFLCSERASYINGTLVTVDGGLARGLPQ